MNDILDLVQSTLDTLLADTGVYSFWGRRAEIGSQTAEYIIYSIDEDSSEVSADGDLYFRTASVSLQYYVKYAIARTSQGRKDATKRMKSILNAMRAAGFGCPAGWSEIGDVDGLGYATFRSTYEIPHYVGGDDGSD